MLVRTKDGARYELEFSQLPEGGVMARAIGPLPQPGQVGGRGVVATASGSDRENAVAKLERHLDIAHIAARTTLPEPSSARLARAAYDVLVAISNLLSDAARIATPAEGNRDRRERGSAEGHAGRASEAK